MSPDDAHARAQCTVSFVWLAAMAHVDKSEDLRATSVVVMAVQTAYAFYVTKRCGTARPPVVRLTTYETDGSILGYESGWLMCIVSCSKNYLAPHHTSHAKELRTFTWGAVGTLSFLAARVLVDEYAGIMSIHACKSYARCDITYEFAHAAAVTG
jgi:hypothetical protein